MTLNEERDPGARPVPNDATAGSTLPATPSSPAISAPTATAASLAAVKLPRGLLASVGLLVLTLACAGYAFTGSPSFAGIGPPPVAIADGVDANGPSAGMSDSSGAAEITPAQIATMVDRLAARMKERPDDIEGWTMLARSYMVLGRPADAVPAYAKAAALHKDDANLLADWADAIAASNNGHSNAESTALVERALTLDANNIKAIAIAGSSAYDRGDYDRAIAQWTRVAAALPPNSELAGQVQVSIADAREKARASASGKPLAPSMADATSAGAIASAAPALAATANTASAPQAAAEITGTVTLAPALAARASPDDTVFVFARAAGGSPMPLAVMRAKVSQLPLRFKLDDSMAMGPMARLSSAASVIVGARISKGGDPIAHDGDLNGQSKPMAPRAANVAIQIDEVVKR